MLDFNKVTDGSITGNGYFDKLMVSLRNHIQDAVTENEITQAEAGAIYTGVIPSMIEQAVNFAITDEQIRLGKVPSTLK
jgi:hypothetical protein